MSTTTTTATNKVRWTKTRWPFDRAHADKLDRAGVDVLKRKIRGGKVILVCTYPFNYVVSCGANSDRSHSGCLYGIAKQQSTTIKEAIQLIETRIPNF